MSTSARKISETFNGRREWQIGGASFFKLLGTINPVDVELYLEGRQRLVAAQVEGGFYQRIDFDRVVITTGGAEAVDWLFGPAEGGSDRFTGSVSIVGTPSVLLDPEQARYFLFGDDEARDGEAFIGQVAAGPTAAQVSILQLWNPPGSGRIVYLDAVQTLDRSGGDSLNVSFFNASIGAAGANVSNKSFGGAGPAAQVRFGTAGAGAGTPIAQYNTVSLQNIQYKAPIRLPEGQGFVVNGLTVNHLLVATFEWREKTD